MTVAKRGSSTGRNPPNNITAEVGELGSLLVSREVVAQVVDLGLRVEHFYKPSHQHIYSAMLNLIAADVGVDVITVADELRRAGLLEECGGTQYLLELQSAIPAISNAARDAKIVKDTATLRRLIAVAAEVTELAYNEPDDIDAAVGQASDLLAQVTVDASHNRWRIFAGPDDDDTPPLAPTLLYRSDGTALLYRGREHALQGEPASGKTWIALMVAAEVLAADGTVVMLDLEDSRAMATERLRALGASSTHIERFLHTDGRDRDTGHELSIAELTPTIAAANPDLVIVDSITEACSRWQFDEDKADDVNQLRAQLIKPFTAADVTTIVLDHVVKSNDNRGRYARGSGSKLSGISGAAYIVRTDGFNRKTPGHIFLKVAKDRPGGLAAVQGKTIAQVWMPPALDNQPIQFKIEPPPDDQPKPGTGERRSADDATQTAALVDHIAALFANKPMLIASTKQIKDELRAPGKDRKTFRDVNVPPALIALRDSGQLIETDGPRGAKVFRLPPSQGVLDDIGGRL
ncbi:hypothetical protein BH10ACT2_BH10ACT2_08420 [soil metagenome]